MQIETVPFRKDDRSNSSSKPTEIDSDNRVQACRILGRFDAHESEQFRTYFDDAVAANVQILIIDLSEVEFVDSTALAELVRAMKQLREDGGNLILRRPSSAVQIILELTKLNQAFTVEMAA